VSSALRLSLDPAGGCSMRAALRGVFASEVPLVMLSSRAVDQLARVVGGPEQAAALLLRLASRHNKPCGVNVSSPDGTSRTTFFSPPDWSQERLAGYVAGAHVELEELFGPISHLERPEAR
jgi:hypothetical protein